MRFLLFFTLLIGLLSSCRDSEQELFVMESEVRLDFQAGLSTLDRHGYILENIPSTFVALSTQNGFPIESVSRVAPSIASLQGVFNEIDYSIVEDITIDIVDAEGKFAQREIFYQEIIPNNHSGPLQLFGTITDLKELLTEDFFNLIVEIRFRVPTTQFLENRINFSFVAFSDE